MDSGRFREIESLRQWIRTWRQNWLAHVATARGDCPSCPGARDCVFGIAQQALQLGAVDVVQDLLLQPMQPHDGDEAARRLLVIEQWCEGALPADGSEPLADKTADQAVESAAGVGPRNALFVKWYEAEGGETYHKPAKIRDRWNAMELDHRKRVCSNSPARVELEAVRKAIRRARAAVSPKPKKT